MSVISIIESTGPLVTLILAVLLLTKELLLSTGRTGHTLHVSMNVIIVPLFVLFVAEIAIIIFFPS